MMDIWQNERVFGKNVWQSKMVSRLCMGWAGDKEQDPWEWCEIIARTGTVAYGKFRAISAECSCRNCHLFFALQNCWQTDLFARYWHV